MPAPASNGFLKVYMHLSFGDFGDLHWDPLGLHPSTVFNHVQVTNDDELPDGLRVLGL